MELPIWGQLLTGISLFGAGFGAHAYLHHHDRDGDKARISELEVELENERNQQCEIVVREATFPTRAERVASIALPEDESTLLSSISKSADRRFQAPKNWSDEKFALNRDRLIEKNFVSWGPEGIYITENGREWLSAHNMIE